jgi:hypothetical protein
MSGSVTPTNCRVYNWKLPRTTSANNVWNSLDRTSRAMPTFREVVLDRRGLHAVHLRGGGLQRQVKARSRPVAVRVGKAGRVEQSPGGRDRTANRGRRARTPTTSADDSRRPFARTRAGGTSRSHPGRSRGRAPFAPAGSPAADPAGSCPRRRSRCPRAVSTRRRPSSRNCHAISGDRSLTTMSTVPLRSSRPRMVSSGTTFSTRRLLRGAPP